MKARPILFSGPMVRALLEGRKTQTRRVVKAKTQHEGITDECATNNAIEWRLQDGRWFGLDGYDTAAYVDCPYGQPGDLLWVRETMHEDCHGSVSMASYSADNAMTSIPWWYSKKSMPSIHMQRRASRLTLLITGIRVERLQEISEEDALAEGVDGEEQAAAIGAEWYEKPRRAFRRLWESINGPDSWNANPWVWVIQFEVIRKNVDEVVP